tara:strand:+ start:15852 stop:16898 length:1047 start_codon:yes stop_codon:yes gene_type:complete
MKSLLTISIPTYNRPAYLRKCLDKIAAALKNIKQSDRDLVSILVSDNSEDCFSREVVDCGEFDDLCINYIKNEKNIGSDLNLANCYSIPVSEYVMLVGDDDFLEEDFFVKVLPLLKTKSFDLVFFKTFGLTYDSSEKRPKSSGATVYFNSAKEVLFDRNIHIGFISSTIYKRELCSQSEIHAGVGTNLVQVNFAFEILKRNGKCVYLADNLLASTRNNTGGYDPVDIFLGKFFGLLKNQDDLSLSPDELRILKIKILNTFYTRVFAQYIRSSGAPLSLGQIAVLDASFGDYYLYKYFYKKLFKQNSKLSFFALSFAYVLGNIIFYPHRSYDFLHHFKNKFHFLSRLKV